MRQKLYFAAVVLALLLQGEARAEEMVVDRIVAIVGDQIILLSEAQRQLEAQMMERNLDRNSPPQVLSDLQHEVVDAMVNEELLQVKAKQDSIVADARDIDAFAKSEYARIRKQFPDDDEFQKTLAQAGLTDQQLRYMYMTMAKKNVIQQIMLQKIEQSVSVSPQELEAWFEANKDSLKQVPEQVRFSHIMIAPKVAEAKKDAAREKLQSIRNELKNGADFAELANKYSEIPGGAKDGGFIGYIKRGDVDERFASAAFALNKGEVSDIVETGLGMHLIKVEDIRADEISARHIVVLLKTDAQDEQELSDRMSVMRDDILSGKVKFEDLAREVSEDESTKDFGGQTKWIARDDPNLPASFLAKISAMDKGEISLPFKSEYKTYHIMRLDDIREAHTVNLKDDRNTLESLVKQQKIIREFERIFAELRKETYIDIKVD